MAIKATPFYHVLSITHRAGFSPRNCASRGARFCCREDCFIFSGSKTPWVKNLYLNNKNFAVWENTISSRVLLEFLRTANFPCDFHICMEIRVSTQAIRWSLTQMRRMTSTSISTVHARRLLSLRLCIIDHTFEPCYLASCVSIP